jgi:outer membrane immunogenic protein
MRKMRLSAVALFFAFVGPAAAADLMEPPAAQIPVQAADWSGFYAGVHGGYAWANRTGCFAIFTTTPLTSCPTPPNPADFNYNQAGGLIGAQAGYNWQPAQHFVLGLQADGSLADIAGTLTGPAAGVGTWTSMGTATAKAGIAGNRWMAYVEGGYAIANMNFVGNTGCNFNMTHTGPVAGVGIGMKLSQKVSLDLKYDHAWLGTQDIGCTTFGFAATQVRTTANMDIVKLGLNYNFGN